MTDVDQRQRLQDLGMMTRIRGFEEAVARLHAEGVVIGSVHLCNGQEAIAAGACGELDLTRDAVFATYRGHGWAIACGVPMHRLAAELAGRETGTNGGRGGSAYLSSPEHGFYGENSIVGAHFPIAVGAALAARFDGSGRVALAVAGDGALNEGATHEAMNMAAVMDLPVVFLIENNGYSELTPIDEMVRVNDLYRRGSVYGMRSGRIDGNDIGAVRSAVRSAVELCRDGRGPVLIEARTERLVGHYIGDVQAYRPPGEVASALSREPIGRTRAALLADGVDPNVLDEIEARSRAEVEAAVESVREDPFADPDSVSEHLYA